MNGTIVAVVIGTALVDLLGPALDLPDWLRQLALSTHLGEPMIGRWDAAGIGVRRRSNVLRTASASVARSNSKWLAR